MQNRFTALKKKKDVLELFKTTPSANSYQLVMPNLPVFPFSGCHINGIVQYIVFSHYLLSPNSVYLRFFHVIVWIDSSFLFIPE